MADFIQVRGFEEAVRPPVGRRRPRITDRPGAGSRSPSDVSPRTRLERIASRTPEVMVKITGRTRDGAHLANHLSYISRNGAVALEGPDGDRLTARAAVRDLGADWMAEVELEPHRRKDSAVSVSVILSMPPGTEPYRVHDAARAFAHKVFGQTHPYVFALHTDERHPHVHLTVRALGRDGRRLNPRKSDLEEWRQEFASALRDRGVEAEATPRRARGVVRKPDRGAVRHIRERSVRTNGAPARVDVAAVRQALDPSAARPWMEAIRTRQAKVRLYFVAQAEALSRSDDLGDRRLGAALERFVETLPPVATRSDELVSELKTRAQGGALRSDRSHGDPTRRR